MSDNQKNTQSEEVKLEQVEGVRFGDVVAEFKTSLAFNKEARDNEEVHDVTLAVNLAGVPLKDALRDFLAQCAVKFQRARRDEEKGGSFSSKEAFDQYIDELGDRVELHYNDVGKAPQEPITDEEAESKADQFFAQMSEEKREEWLAKHA